MMECSTEDTASSWSEVPHRIRAGDVLPEPWESLFGPLRATSPLEQWWSVRSVNRLMDALHAFRPFSLHKQVSGT